MDETQTLRSRPTQQTRQAIALSFRFLNGSTATEVLRSETV